MATNAIADDYYGSLAIDVKTGRTGYSYDYWSEGEAEAAALSECQKSEDSELPQCEVVYTFWNSCAAIAWSEEKEIYETAWSEDDTSNTEIVAINRCNNTAGTSDCELQAHVCTSWDEWYY